MDLKNTSKQEIAFKKVLFENFGTSLNHVLQAGSICYEMWPNLICSPNHL